MATINVNFDKKSIQKAIEQLKKLQDKKLIATYLLSCANWVINRANFYLLQINMDGNIIADIMNGWETPEPNEGVVMVRNKSAKAVFVEFGVGRVGERNPHPNSAETAYEYDIKTVHKHKDGMWRFSPDGKIGIDLQAGYYETKINDNGKEMVRTHGSPASLYLYNASRDFITTGAYKELWRNAVETVLKG